MKKFEEFQKVRVLVVGDVMLDRYWWGDVNRISPEAPVPIVALDKKSSVAGGAANVAANVKGLGATPYLIGCVGADKEADELRDSLNGFGVSTEHLLEVKHRPTTVKTRVIANHQQVVRVDDESVLSFSEELDLIIWNQIEKVLDNVEVVLVSDYAKGIVTENLARRLIESSKKRNVAILVDPKGNDYRKYKNATILTPNEKEVLDSCGYTSNNKNLIFDAGKLLIAKLNLQYLLVTRGKDGMVLFLSDSEVYELAAKARRVYDVTGAGDTVISTLAVSMGAGINFQRSCEIANKAAGIVVEKLGTQPIKLKEIENNKQA